TYQVEINWNNCVVLSDCITVTTLGIKNEEHHHIMLYPNPSKGIFYLRGIETATVSVYDISSKYIGRFNLKSQEEGVDLSNYPAGVYTIKVQDEKQKVKTFKFIKM
ncbi:MAG: T9SS type A sorting domain-containing protein, partial [Flavobacterium sp.]|nr:T9SS type A sorting domain-containing protein [Candidatus Neoflavobacterium equi]